MTKNRSIYVVHTFIDTIMGMLTLAIVRPIQYSVAYARRRDEMMDRPTKHVLTTTSMNSNLVIILLTFMTYSVMHTSVDECGAIT
ncbi:hypothetical protein BC936DRAFT_148650 [Jimgerdemannia flammicorona]|uniref:Uncharacterized protein n=1 Tax=Jimgerdemannia flammicorona TaxID=994334 RepID=A0A433D2S4_9FUNG|nr:hypothetical protein BC936DRAFT_148650 [Jimgerdemannia flammicorona]